MRSKVNQNHGFSLVELMMAVAISGIAALGISTVYSNYIQQKYMIESKSAAQSDIDTASNFIRASLPSVIANTTGPKGNTDLPAGWWNCTDFGNQCILSAYLTADKTASNAVTQIMSDQCVNIADSALKASSINTLAVDTVNAGECTKCPQGTMPVLHIQTFANSGTQFTNTYRDIVLPAAANTIGPGLISTGLCFNHAGYDPNAGTSAQNTTPNKFDRWTVTLIGIYLKAPIPAGATGAQVDNLLAKVTERVMVAAPQQLGSDINFMPTR